MANNEYKEDSVIKKFEISPEFEKDILEAFPNIPTNNDTHTPSENVNVNGNANGTCRRTVNSALTQSRRDAISQLKACNYLTEPKVIANLLGTLFEGEETEEGHWLYIAQKWTPRAINRVITLMTKQKRTGEEVIRSPSAYFTYLIKLRKKRKKHRRGRSKTNE